MDNRKKQRLEVPRSANTIITVNNTTAINNANTQAAHVSTSLLAGTNTLFLDNGSDLGALPANVFLTICDDDDISDDESQEYYAIDSNTLAEHIKQEQQDMSTQTLPPLQQIRLYNTQQQQPAQYQTQRALLTTPTLQIATTTTTTTTLGTNALLPASVQLPSGCEIYLVKEYIDTDEINASNCALSNVDILEIPKNAKIDNTTTTTNSFAELKTNNRMPSSMSNGQCMQHNNNNKLLEAATPAGQDATTTTTTNTTTAKITTTTATATLTTNITTNTNINSKRQNITLDAYKKRDDKRRATHNEVERRRRDKINNWIFKLKEMLPNDMPNINNNNSNNNNINSVNINGSGNSNSSQASSSATTKTPTPPPPPLPSSSLININQHNTNRTPPSDSKSQILIKACEYIKTMQQEIKCLRECLTENEELRLSNLRLQSELQKLKNERLRNQQQQQLHPEITNDNINVKASVNINNNNNNKNNNFNLTLNNLNAENSFFTNTTTKIPNILRNNLNKSINISLNSSTTPQITTTTTSAPAKFTKRELIIRDYVD